MTRIAALLLLLILSGCQAPRPPSSPPMKLTYPGAAEDHRFSEHLAARTPEARAARAQQYAQTHPEAPPYLIKDIRTGTIRVGMTREETEAVMGPPWSTSSEGGIGPTIVTLTYKDDDFTYSYLYITNGKLVRWHFSQ